ncbi:1-deoxy-D-xylulose-5-phosphate synthase [Parabacteroides sp. FAFU027]|uniref:1-deoxy-D-xylulose-5-phosphate synthase n=1 Tax=Parabacteroides sp. FAFU027 TaxID=2922715 RepID=UPI001FAF2108|nr:1-deoxy-D-xylulose-5-phosphate synthase [Parabacteroides sp. FAFU027]
MPYRFLKNINSPADLRQLKQEDLTQVCGELRNFIIDVLCNNPGHFAASLGVVEMTVALHYVFKTPYDRIVWDVGHQAYGHKILCGRRDVFHTNRKFHGISGFPNPAESEYDSFIAGHASTSISAALGMAVAADLKEENDRHVVAVIGDGSMTGGLAYEGLNNASINPNKLIIILNDNHMAIDQNVGGLSEYLVNLTTSQTYNKIRYDLYRFLRRAKIIDTDRKDSIIRFNNSLKSLLTGQHNIFEGLNIRYFGPIDGHDVNQVIKVLNDIKDLNGPKLIHLITTKGKGFEPAEKSATVWHAPGVFNKETGERLVKKTGHEPPLYQEVFGRTLVELAEKNEKIVGITPAMPSGCSMNYMMEKMPRRAFDVGIAEGHAVTFSAGLAKEGLLPFCNIYSSFMQRGYDQVIHDVALQNLNVVMCLDRAGLVGEDGATHHGVFDIAYMRCIPNLTIAAPMNEHQLRNLMYSAQLPDKGPFVIRYPRGKGVLADWENTMEEITIGKGRKLKEGNDVAVLSLGHIGNDVENAIEQASNKGLSVAHYDMVFVKPLDEELLHEIARKFTKVITVETGMLKGGFGSAVLEFFADNGYAPKVKRIGLPDHFVEHGTVAELNQLCHLDVDSIAKEIIGF